MACVENVNFSILINGLPTNFFAVVRGLRQGCSLSPLLFILAMDSLSLHINGAVRENKFKPIRICRGYYISHSLFIDDITIFGMICRLSWQCVHDILRKFQNAYGIYINEGKSSFFFDVEDLESLDFLSTLFNIGTKSLKEGIKYLGFHLIPTGYKSSNWLWLTDMFYKRIEG